VYEFLTLQEVCSVWKCCVWSLTATQLWIVNSIRCWNRHLVSVQVSAGDGLPCQVCCCCAKPVTTGYTFKLQVEKTGMLLWRYVSSHSEEDGCIKCRVWTDVWPLLGCEAQSLVASSMFGLGWSRSKCWRKCVLTEQNAGQAESHYKDSKWILWKCIKGSNIWSETNTSELRACRISGQINSEECLLPFAIEWFVFMFLCNNINIWKSSFACCVWVWNLVSRIEER